MIVPSRARSDLRFPNPQWDTHDAQAFCSNHVLHQFNIYLKIVDSYIQNCDLAFNLLFINKKIVNADNLPKCIVIIANLSPIFVAQKLQFISRYFLNIIRFNLHRPCEKGSTFRL